MRIGNLMLGFKGVRSSATALATATALAMCKVSFKLKETQKIVALLRLKNTKEIIINHKQGTMMVKDEKD